MAKKTSQRVLIASLLSGLLFVAAALAADKNSLGAAIATQRSSVQAAASSQLAIDRVADQSRQLLDEYNFTMQRYDALQVYNQQVQKLLDSQQQELDAIAQQLIEVDLTHQGIVPLMIDMVDALRQFVALDRPFLLEERQARVKALAALLDNAQLSTAEQYRRIVEAYQIEMQYGHTIEAYAGQLILQGEKWAGNFLRIGRIVLIFQTPDEQQRLIWQNGGWEPLTPEYAAAVTLGMRIARKQTAPDWLVLPIGMVEQGQ